ncbi:hypothetical protein AB1Y20_000575 [Prymnesium parvum]|uniref:Uncharacterized protein n=1 Tax=Prymnesium parvum TaxID=97485 RepID=A0AB34K8W2_PRYPA
MGDEELPEQLAAAMSGKEELKREILLLKAMPQDRLLDGSVFDRAMPPGTTAQLRGVVVKLRCCKKPFDQKCNELDGPRACITHADAARLLRQKIVKLHGSEECMKKVEAGLALESAEGSSAGPSRSAFHAMRRELTTEAARAQIARAHERVASAADIY